MESRGRTSLRRDRGSIADGSHTADGLSGSTGSVVTTDMRGRVGVVMDTAAITATAIMMGAATEMDDPTHACIRVRELLDPGQSQGSSTCARREPARADSRAHAVGWRSLDERISFAPR
jgi:hypothetical protein